MSAVRIPLTWQYETDLSNKKSGQLMTLFKSKIRILVKLISNFNLDSLGTMTHRLGLTWPCFRAETSELSGQSAEEASEEAVWSEITRIWSV